MQQLAFVDQYEMHGFALLDGQGLGFKVHIAQRQLDRSARLIGFGRVPEIEVFARGRLRRQTHSQQQGSSD
jgi:hypothetical protein